MQIKNNFRDPAVASFGGDRFNEIADHADDMYNSMAPPKASLAPSNEKAVAANIV